MFPSLQRHKGFFSYRAILVRATFVLLTLNVSASQKAVTIDLGPTSIEFSKAVEYLQHPDGSVSISLQSLPELVSISTATSNRGGAMWEPFEGEEGHVGADDQGWDVHIVKKNGNSAYNAALNVAPESTGASFIPAGNGSLVIGIPNPTPGKNWREQLNQEPNQQYRVVNFMKELPTEGSYRSAVRGPTEVRPNWNQSTVRRNLDQYFPHDIDFELQSREQALQSLSEAKAIAAAGISWTAFPTESRQPKDGWNAYGRSWCTSIGQAILNLRNTQLTPEERAELADAIVQIGIDHYGIVRDGAFWQMNGGWTHGRIWAVDIAGLLLEDKYIRNIANDPLNSEMAPGETLSVFPFVEQRQYIPVTLKARTTGTRPEVSGQVAEWGPAIERLKDTKDTKMPPGPQEVGLPLWNVSNDRGGKTDVISITIGRTYHGLNINSQIYPRLAYDWLYQLGFDDEFTGTKYIRDGVDLALQSWDDFDARRNEIAAQGIFGTMNGYVNRGAEGYKEMLNLNQRFRTRPSRAYPPLVQIKEDDAKVKLNAMEASHGYPITQRDIRWRINDGQWTELLDVQDGFEFPHGGLPGQELTVQVRLHNQDGFGSWSTRREGFGYALIP